MKDIIPQNGKTADKREFNGDVSLLFDLEMLKPLADFPFATQPILAQLHSLGHGWYLLVGPRRFLRDGLPTDTLRACMVFWALDIESARLAIGSKEETALVSNQSPAQLPPVEVLVPAKGWRYGELVKAGRGEVMETATYGSDGVFLYKKLWFPKVGVYFRSRRRKDQESPFAISLVHPGRTRN